ncbi:MAG: Uma2 family endonuclease [Planctomycetia bacterium]|nr:Uma2 family endonuclease [Planctomycetia bacterium]
MSVETLPLQLGPDANGMLISPDEFDSAECERGWRYELIRGVLIVTPAPLEEERDPNEELGFLLRRRRADRVIWTGLGRRPKRGEVPAIVIEFVSSGKRSRTRDYVEKRNEYLRVGIQEYWIIDRFQRTMTVHLKRDAACETKLVHESETYATPLLPGFQLPLARLFALADAWDD